MNLVTFLRIDGRRFAGAVVLFVGLVLFGHTSLYGGVDANGNKTAEETSDGKTAPSAPTAEEEPEGKNWVEVGVGGLITKGDAAQFKQEHRISGDVFGGIQDMHYEQTIGKNTQFTADAHAIFDNHDYDVKMELSQPGLGYIRAGYTEFRSWYDGNGGFFPGNGQFFAPRHPEDTLDRGEAWVELGLRMPKLPEITLHYSHQFRDGRKDSTEWGDTTLTGLGVNPTRKIAPAFRDIDETRDILSVDILQNFGKTDVGIGMRYEHSDVDDRLQLDRGAGQGATERFITQNDKNGLDAYNGHVTTETRFSDSLWFTSAYSYSTLDSDLSGTRIAGTDYNSMFGQAPQFTDSGFINLAGISEVNEHVVNLNLLWMPAKNLTVLTAFRYTHEDKDSASTFLATTSSNSPTTPRSADTSEEYNNFAETLEARYTGIANWVFYARGDWEEETGNVREHEVVGPNDQGSLKKDTDLLSQKYTVGANWYPMAILNLSSQYYHKMTDYDNDFKSELLSPPPNNLGRERNQRLLSQELNTDDVNFRVTWRPKIPAKLGTLALVTRYDFGRSTIDGRWAISPTSTPVMGTLNNTFLASQQTAVLTNHVVTESITWNPSARLYLQGDFSYVFNKTDTPADYNLIPNTSVTILDFKNDYWTVSGAAGYALDQKTDLRAEYTFYRADNYVNNALVAVPYGMGATEHTVSASVSRQIAKNVRLKLQYSYFNYTDELFGGHNNYEAHALYSSLQFRF